MATALLGGISLGVAASSRLLFTGRVLGWSGIVRGTVLSQVTTWRLLVILGLALGATLAVRAAPQAFDVVPPSFTVERAALGGALVGIGSSMGNGCTSGHGICGLSRLSARSLVFTLVFMVVAMATAMLTGTASALGAAPQASWLPSASPVELLAALGLLGFAACSTAVLAAATPSSATQAKAEVTRREQLIECLAELVSGLVFGLGMVVTGMVRPAKVAAFLSIGQAVWDPALLLVMGGALLVSLPGFQAILRGCARGHMPRPLSCSAFALPSASKVDARLLAGAVLFGAGWGLAGMCPAPALVALVARPGPQVATWVAAMLAGMVVEDHASKALGWTA